MNLRVFGIRTLYLTSAVLVACGTIRNPPDTTGEQNRQMPRIYGYTPLDPLPVNTKIEYSSIPPAGMVIPEPTTTEILHQLPDETIRIATTDVTSQANVGYGPATISEANHDYEVIVDYIKFQTMPEHFVRDSTPIGPRFTLAGPMQTQTQPQTGTPLVIPTYVGVGLRLTASVHAISGKIDLSNLIALGAAAQAGRVSGTLVVQTLGVTGPGISALLPMPSELNQTTIQNAIVALGGIKARLYDDATQVSPRVVAIYNNFSGGRQEIDQVESQILENGPAVYIRRYLPVAAAAGDH